ncbi:MAG: SOS response-associated peptidase family protein [Pseudobdellovibrionaceae bacterium]
MCAQFILKAKANELAKKFGIKLPEKLARIDFEIRVQGFLKTDEAPVIRQNNKGDLEITMMKFSLCPSWSKEFPPKFTTYNARMERENKGKFEKIYQVPTWKESFVKGQTCLVPINAAIESSYFGLSAGKMIRFLQKDLSTYYVAGLWSSWVHKESGEIIESFTLITDDPYEFFFKHGHDRSVFVIHEKAFDEWLKNKSLTPEERFKFLRANRVSLDWAVEEDRPMKSGWEKRAPSEKEIAEIKVWAG